MNSVIYFGNDLEKFDASLLRKVSDFETHPHYEELYDKNADFITSINDLALIKIENEMKELQMELNEGLNIYLNVNQTFLINSSSMVVSIVKLSVDSFLNKTLSDQRISFPSQ